MQLQQEIRLSSESSLAFKGLRFNQASMCTLYIASQLNNIPNLLISATILLIYFVQGQKYLCFYVVRRYFLQLKVNCRPKVNCRIEFVLARSNYSWQTIPIFFLQFTFSCTNSLVLT